MDLAVLEQKNLVNAWKKAQSRQSKNKIRSWSASRKFKQEKKPLDVYPTLWMLVALSCLVGSLIGKSLS